MKWPTVLGSVMLAACTETPRPQLDLAVAGQQDLSQAPTSLDLTGSVPTADLMPPAILPPTLTKVAPSALSTAGGPVTLTGSNFSVGTAFFINNLLVNFSLTSATTAVLALPALPGQIGAVQITVRNPDGQSVTNSNTAGSATALSTYPAHVNFTVHDEYIAEVLPRGVAVGQGAKDANPLMVVGNFTSTDYDVLVGDGKGNFSRLLPTSSFATVVAGQAPFAVQLTDINNDGYTDLLLGTNSSTFQYLLGNGTGLFNTNVSPYFTKSYTSSGALPVQSFAIADMNQDKYPDLVMLTTPTAATTTTSTIQVQYNQLVVAANTGADIFNAAGLGGAPAASTAIALGTNCSRVVAVDINQDNYPDVIAVGQSALTALPVGGTLNVLVNQIPYAATTTLPFGAVSPSPVKQYGSNGAAAASQTPQWVEVADLNNDGFPDAVVTDYLTGHVRVFLNLGGAGQAWKGFPTTASSTYAVNLGPTQVSIVDVNLDGNADLVVANGNAQLTGGTTFAAGSSITVLLGDGAGNFPSRLDLSTLSNQPWAIVAKDINGDGLPDLIVTDQTNSANTAAVAGNVTTFLNTSQ